MKIRKALVYFLALAVITGLLAARVATSRHRTAARSADIPEIPAPSAGNVISWESADKYYGSSMTVEGEIVLARNTGKVCFLNFHRNYKRYFTAVIFESDFSRFPSSPEEYYLNKKVRVRGLIKEYNGKPEIVLNSPSQIEIIK